VGTGGDVQAPLAARHAEARARVAATASTRVEAPWPPCVPAGALTSESLAHAVAGAGCGWVDGQLHPDEVTRLTASLDRAFAGYDAMAASGYESIDDAHAHARPDPWFTLFIPEPGTVHTARPWIREGGGLYTADSPMVAEAWFRLLHERGVVDVVTGWFGEAPLTSVDKCTLRRIGAGHGDGIEWHQDGAFLGPESGALNLWVALTDCGPGAPGLELVPRRLGEIVETGTGGATYDWSVGPDVVAELTRAAPVVRPQFRAGDAFLFDGYLLHRTEQSPEPPTRTRYAIETWFFRPSRFPAQQQVPLAI
jgi:hypothetical protein